MDKINETGIFYNKIESDYKELLKELMQKDCQRVEFIRGQLSVYSEILENGRKASIRSGYTRYSTRTEI